MHVVHLVEDRPLSRGFALEFQAGDDEAAATSASPTAEHGHLPADPSADSSADPSADPPAGPAAGPAAEPPAEPLTEPPAEPAELADGPEATQPCAPLHISVSALSNDQ